MASLARQFSRTTHLVRGELTPGTEVALRVDQKVTQDTTGTMALMQFQEFDVDRVQVETAVQDVDHNLLQIDFKNPDDHVFLQSLAAATASGSPPGNGICHYVHCERFATPGNSLSARTAIRPSPAPARRSRSAPEASTRLCAWPGIRSRCPVRRSSASSSRTSSRARGLRPRTSSSSSSGGAGCAAAAVRSSSSPGRDDQPFLHRARTIANMIAELGATGAIFPAGRRDEGMAGGAAARGRLHQMPAGDTGDFDEEEHIDLAALTPLVAKL